MFTHQLVLVCIIDIILLGNYTTNTMLKQRNSIDDSPLHMKRTAYESNLMRNFTNAPNEYKLWPELTKETKIELCKKYVGTLFSKKPKTVLTTQTFNIWLHYLEIEATDTPKCIINALQCQIFPPFGHCKFMYFIKSPTPNCLFLCGLLRKNSSKYHQFIMEEICLGDTYYPWKIWHNNKYKRNCITRTLYNRCYNDDFQARKDYESKHSQDYKLNATEYEKWPLLKKEDMEKCCQILIGQLFPNNKYTEFKSDNRVVILKYENINRGKNEGFSSSKVGALQCQLPQKKQKNNYIFIKSSRPECVHLIKKINSSSKFYYIGKQICEGQVLNPKPSKDKCSNSNLKFSVDQLLIRLFEEESRNEDNESMMK